MKDIDRRILVRYNSRPTIQRNGLNRQRRPVTRPNTPENGPVGKGMSILDPIVTKGFNCSEFMKKLILLWTGQGLVQKSSPKLSGHWRRNLCWILNTYPIAKRTIKTSHCQRSSMEDGSKTYPSNGRSAERTLHTIQLASFQRQNRQTQGTSEDSPPPTIYQLHWLHQDGSRGQTVVQYGKKWDKEFDIREKAKRCHQFIAAGKNFKIQVPYTEENASEPVSFPGEEFRIDFTGSLTENGNISTLVYVDRFSEWPMAKNVQTSQPKQRWNSWTIIFVSTEKRKISQQISVPPLWDRN